MEPIQESIANMPGLEADLDLAEMEIDSGRVAEARLRFTRMSRTQRETPRALMLRARATESEESRRMLASFVRQAIERHSDLTARCHLAAALALCGDRTAAQKFLPADRGMSASERDAREQAIAAMGTVPDLPETEINSLAAILSRKLSIDRRARP